MSILWQWAIAFHWELVPGPWRAELCIDCLFDRSNARSQTILMISNVFWVVNYCKQCLKVRSEYISLLFPWTLQFCPGYAIFDELCEKLRFKVNYAKLQPSRISEALPCALFLCALLYFWTQQTFLLFCKDHQKTCHPASQ